MTAARWLALAAAPAFAVMGLVTTLSSGAAPDMLCGGPHGLLLGGMAPMYFLMSASHVPPWLDLASGRRPVAREV